MLYLAIISLTAFIPLLADLLLSGLLTRATRKVERWSIEGGVVKIHFRGGEVCADVEMEIRFLSNKGDHLA